MTSDYEKQIAEFWPAIMQAWDEHGDKHPVIECDAVLRKVAAMPAKEYLNGLSDRSRAAVLKQYEQVTAEGGMMVFVRDSENRTLRSQVFNLNDKQ
jgi:hypothetical protein